MNSLITDHSLPVGYSTNLYQKLTWLCILKIAIVNFENLPLNSYFETATNIKIIEI